MTATTELHLFDGPYCVEGGCPRTVPDGSRRLVAHVVLAGGWVDRRAAAGALWPAGSDTRAVANLRSALWRLRGAGVSVLEGDASGVWLRAGTVVDLHQAVGWADRVMDGAGTDADLDLRRCPPVVPRLLPGLSDEWVQRERDLLRHHLLHGWEALVARLVAAGRAVEGVAAARAVVAADPLRASARRALRAALEAHDAPVPAPV